MTICIVNGTGPHFYVKRCDLEGKTAAEIISFLKLKDKDYIITYENEFFWEPIPDDSIPLNDFPDIENQSELEKKSVLPKIHLTLFRSSMSDMIGRKISVETQLEKTPFPCMTLTFQKENPSLKISDLLVMILKNFVYQNTDPKIFFGDEEVAGTDEAQPYIDAAKFHHIRFICTVCDVAIKEIKHRECLACEIVSSEESFINDLKSLRDYWEPAFREKIKFTQAQFRSLFRDIPPMLLLHTALLDEMDKPPSYASCFGNLLMNYVEKFKVSAAFVSNFKNIDELMKSCRQKSSFDSKIKEIEDDNPAANGRDFLSYYITPVQRYPRYPLLLRDLNKRTPNWHPDKPFLERALKEVDSVNKNIDNTSMRVKSLMLMENLSNELPESYEILANDRFLLNSTSVRITKPKYGQGFLYLFNDIVLLTQKDKKKQTPIFQIEIKKFHYFNCRPTPDSISLTFKNVQYVINFNEDNDKIVWMESIDQLRSKMFDNLISERSSIFWSDINFTSAPSLCSHAGCKTANGKIFFFGGINASLSPTNNLILFVNNNSFQVMKTKVPSRAGHTVTAIGNNIYICFGSYKSTVYNDIWKYDTETSEWSEIKPNGKIPIARTNHSCVAQGNNLIFFGGEGKASKLLNDVNIFNTEDNSYLIINDAANAPLPRMSHSATIIGKYMAIFGGKREKNICPELYLYNIQKKKWRRVKGAHMAPRFGHQAILVCDRFLLIVGGATDKMPKKSAMVDTQNWKQIHFKRIGNVPQGLCRFALVQLDDDNIMTYGGTDGINKNPFCSSYRVNVTDGLQLLTVQQQALQPQMQSTDTENENDFSEMSEMSEMSENINEKIGLGEKINNVNLGERKKLKKNRSLSKQDLLSVSSHSSVRPRATRHSVQQDDLPNLPDDLNESNQDSQLVVAAAAAAAVGEGEEDLRPTERVHVPHQRKHRQDSLPVGSRPPSLDMKLPSKKKKSSSKNNEEDENSNNVGENSHRKSQNAIPKMATTAAANHSDLSRMRSVPVFSVQQQQDSNSSASQSRFQSMPSQSGPHGASNSNVFDLQSFSAELGIDVSGMNGLQQSIMSMSIKKYWILKRKNDEEELKVKKMELILSGDFSCIPTFPLLMKVFDDRSQETKISKITSEANPTQICDIIGKIISRDVMLNVMVANDQFEDFNQETLSKAYRAVFKGELRTLYINAI